MNTIVTQDVELAAATLKEGGLVAFPTETVFGLGASAFQPNAVSRIFQAKNRPQDNPLIVHIAHRNQIAEVCEVIPEAARVLIDAFFPGPLTLVVPAAPTLPSVVTASLGTVGIRMPDHDVANAFLRACGEPVAAPSANRSGRPSPTTWEAVMDDLDGRVDVILRGDASRVGLESTVVDCTGKEPIILRPGSISLEDLKMVYPGTRMSDAADVVSHRSPGTRHRHYRPEADVVVVSSPSKTEGRSGYAYIGLESPEKGWYDGPIRVPGDVSIYARDLFHFFRTCEKAGINRIECQTVGLEGMGRALMDRLQRAASPE